MFKTIMPNKLQRKDGFAAYPGDTYVSDLRKASKSNSGWVKFLPLAIVMAIIADWYFMQDTLGTAMDWASLDSLGSPRANIPSIVLTALSAIAIIAIYLVVGLTAGKTLKEYQAFRRKSDLGAFIFCLVVEIGAIVAFTFLRYQGELSDQYVDNPVVATAMMAVFMILAAFMMIVYNYLTGDSVETAICINAEKSIAEDKALFLDTFARYAANAEKDRKYERREHEVDERAIKSAFKLSGLAAQLNGIVDAADAYEFQQASTHALDSYYEAN